MRIRGRRSLVPLIFLFLSAPLKGAFEDLGAGARAFALGGAYACIAEDACSLHFNPAGLARVGRQEISTAYGLLHTGLDDKSRVRDAFFAYAYPAKAEIGTFALSWQELASGDAYSERALTFGYGRRISEKWSAGCGLKYLRVKVQAPEGVALKGGARRTDLSDPVFAGGNSGSALGCDLGVLYHLRRNYIFGLAVQNLNEPNVAVSAGGRDAVGAKVRGGLAYREEDVAIVTEMAAKRALQSGWDYAFTAGMEKKFFFLSRRNEIALRGAFGYGSRAFRQFTAGLGFGAGAVQFDYAFAVPLSEITASDTGTAHRLSFTFRFGSGPEPDYRTWFIQAEQKTREAREKLEEAQRSLPSPRQQVAAAHFNKALQLYWRRKVRGASLVERKNMLEEIRRIFADSKIDLAVIREELEEVGSERLKAEEEFNSSWKLYQDMAARDADAPKRIKTLKRMVSRYLPAGVDVRRALIELDELKEQREP